MLEKNGVYTENALIKRCRRSNLIIDKYKKYIDKYYDWSHNIVIVLISLWLLVYYWLAAIHVESVQMVRYFSPTTSERKSSPFTREEEIHEIWLF